jgi:hypothetical protein
MRPLYRFLLILCLSALAVAQHQATTDSTPVVPTLINFSGVVHDLNGKPLSGVVGVTFALYKDSQAGPALWLETQNVQPDEAGHYSVTLGSSTSAGLPSNLFAVGEARWLGVQIEGQEEQPRVLLLSVPYALKAADAQTLGGFPASAFVMSNSGTPAANAGGMTLSAKPNAATSAALPKTTSDVTTTGGTVQTLAFFTTATDIQSSIASQAGTSAINVHGQLNAGAATTGTGAVNVLPINPNHVGISTSGWNAPLNVNANGTDALHANGGQGLVGGVGAVVTGGPGVGNGGTGLVATGGGAQDDFAGGAGIEASGGGLGGIGIFASASNSAASYDNGSAGIITMGGRGGGGATDGPGIIATGASDIEDPRGGDGIDAFAGSAVGFSVPGNAGSFTGTVSVSGDLTVSGTKSFKIDDPLDPANKYLYHASVESSEVLNLYSGNAVLDAEGEATVQLPAWFDTLNRDFRYQLTAIGAAAPSLHIAQEIENRSFKIAGGPADIKVSWQVTAVRQDAWEKAHPMVVEVEKPQNERGYYLNPELFGAPREKSIDWARMPQMMKRLQALQAKQAAQKQAGLANPVKAAARP